MEPESSLPYSQVPATNINKQKAKYYFFYVFATSVLKTLIS
jgi:hypothetical protein